MAVSSSWVSTPPCGREQYSPLESVVSLLQAAGRRIMPSRHGVHTVATFSFLTTENPDLLHDLPCRIWEVLGRQPVCRPQAPCLFTFPHTPLRTAISSNSPGFKLVSLVVQGHFVLALADAEVRRAESPGHPVASVLMAVSPHSRPVRGRRIAVRRSAANTAPGLRVLAISVDRAFPGFVPTARSWCLGGQVHAVGGRCRSSSGSRARAARPGPGSGRGDRRRSARSRRRAGADRPAS